MTCEGPLLCAVGLFLENSWLLHPVLLPQLFLQGNVSHKQANCSIPLLYGMIAAGTAEAPAEYLLKHQAFSTPRQDKLIWLPQMLTTFINFWLVRAGAPFVFFLVSLFLIKSLQLTKTKIWVRLGESLIDPRPIPVIGQQPSHYCNRGRILLSSSLGRGSRLKTVNLLALRGGIVHSKIKSVNICGNLLKNGMWKWGWKTEYFKTGYLQGGKTTGCS